MIVVDAHVHLGSFPSLAKLNNQLRNAEDVIAFRTKYPKTYNAILGEEPIDNSDDLIRALDSHNIDVAIVQARPGSVPNDLVANAVRSHEGRLIGLVRIGHEKLVEGYRGEVSPATLQFACSEIARGVEQFGMRGVGEVFIRAFTTSIHPEKIADDLAPIMDTVDHYRIPIQFPTAWSQFPGGMYWGDPIWTDEVASRYPNVPIVLTKMGRGVQRYFDAVLGVALRNENIYLDTVGTSPEHLSKAALSIGTDRIMFGTDWSATWHYVTDPEDLYTQRLNTIERAQLSDQGKLNVLGAAATRLFNIDTENVVGNLDRGVEIVPKMGDDHG